MARNALVVDNSAHSLTAFSSMLPNMNYLPLDAGRVHLLSGRSSSKEIKLARAKTKRVVRMPYTTADIKLLKQHSKARTPVSKISKQMKRSVGSLRQKALKLGVGLGHQR